MREIKFRGKRILEPINIDQYAPNGWVYGGLIDCSDEMYILPYDVSGEMYIDRPYRFRANDYECRVMLAQVEPKSIGQFTGLRDKNGKEIYEGDIVEAFDGEEILKVDWIKSLSNYGFRCYGKRKKTKQKKETLSYLGYSELVDYSENGECANLKVIGNIYDNPELLRGEKE